MASAEFLRQVPVLADLPDELLDQVAAEAQEVTVRAGELLFREGDEAESLFVIRSGRMEVFAEGPPEVLIRVLRRGEVLGELALLAGGGRSVSVRARRDSELLEVSRGQFERLISDVPGFALGLVRAMGAQLAASRAPAVTARLPATVAVIGLDAAVATTGIAESLAGALLEAGTVATLTAVDTAAPDAERIARLDQAQADADRVVLVGSAHERGDPWTDFCLREADLVVAITTHAPSRDWIAHPDALHGCELVLIGATEIRPELLAALRPREAHAVAAADYLPTCIDTMARRLSGRGVGIVLSGGGARAFAHLGVIEELTAAGIRVDRIAGVSLGSAVGAGMAAGYSMAELIDRFAESFANNNPTGDYTLPFFALVRGRRTRDMLVDYLGDRRIEALPTRFFCLSCDLIAREPVIHRTGPVADAVHASLSIPGIFPPRPTPDGRLLVDGGVLDNLPVAEMAETQEGPVIAVDVTGKMGSFKKPTRPGIARMARPLRRFMTGREDELPRLGETVIRTVTVGSIDTAAESVRHADLVIEPEVESIGLLDWGSLEAAREAGRAAARTALSSSSEWGTW